MDRRRNRRGRGHSHATRTNLPHSFTCPCPPAKPWSVLSGLNSLIIMSVLIGLIYMMLEHHCNNCKDKCFAGNITKSIDDIANNLSAFKDSYYELEMKISKFSQDLPKLEGQIDILEALANTIEKSHLGWDPKSQLPLPNVDVCLNRKCSVQAQNSSRRCCAVPPLPIPKTVQVNQD